MVQNGSDDVDYEAVDHLCLHSTYVKQNEHGISYWNNPNLYDLHNVDGILTCVPENGHQPVSKNDLEYLVKRYHLDQVKKYTGETKILVIRGYN